MTRVACVQLTSTDDVAANIAAATAGIMRAADDGASFITLPENAFYMHGERKPPQWSTRAHEGVDACRELARRHVCWVLIGSIMAFETENQKPVNRSIVIDDSGAITAIYDKIHLFDVALGGSENHQESKRFEAGAHAVMTSTPLGRTGLSVCYDLRFPALYQALAKAGATALTVPSAFTHVTGSAHWHVLLRARAIENSCFVIAPAQCGTHPGGRQTYGHSLIVGPWGEVLADGGEQPGVVCATLDLAQVDEVRAKLPSLCGARPFALKPA